MPKTQPKTKPKNTKDKNSKNKVQPKPASLTQRKSYWIGLSIMMTAFGAFYGYYLKVSPAATAMLLASVLTIIGFGYYMNFTASPLPPVRRAMLIVGGTSIIGFSIWAVIVLSLERAALITSVDNAIGNAFFAITSLIICLAAGAVAGDQLGKNGNAIQQAMHKTKNKLFRLDG